MAERYITSSELLDQDTRAVLMDNPVVLVSGQPTYHGTSDGKEFYYGDCAGIVDVPLFVHQALITSVPIVGHRHLNPSFIGTYPQLSGTNPETNDEFIVPIIPELGFSVTTPDSEVAMNPLFNVL